MSYDEFLRFIFRASFSPYLHVKKIFFGKIDPVAAKRRINMAIASEIYYAHALEIDRTDRRTGESYSVESVSAHSEPVLFTPKGTRYRLASG